MTNQITNNIENKFIYLPIYLSDYVSQSRKLTMLQRGALIDLSVLYFQENLKINYTKEQIYRLVFAFTIEEQNAIDFILENYFTKSENKPTGYFWVSNQLDEIGGKVLKKLNASRENGKKGGRGNKKEIKPIGLDLLNPEKTILNESKLNQIKENEINLEKPKIKKFKKPSIQEIKDYCQERKNSVDAEKFFDYYEARAWKEIKNWQACVRTWEKNGYSSNSKPQAGYRDTYSYNPNNYKHLNN